MRLGKLLVVVVLALASSWAWAVDPAVRAATRPARSPQELADAWKKAAEALRAVLPSPMAIADPEVRKQVAPAAVPLLQRGMDIMDDMYAVGPASKEEARKAHYHILAILAFLDDKASLAELDDARKSDNKEVAGYGRHAWYLAQWWRNVDDPQKLEGIMKEFEEMARQYPMDDGLTSLLLQIREEGTLSQEQTNRIEGIITKYLRGPAAQRAIGQFKAAEKRRILLGKPLVVKCTTLDGKSFSTEALRGKWVLVHFGMTTCIPWDEEQNRLLQLHQKVDTKKVEFVTVLCDPKQSDVDEYVERHNEVPWPVLRDTVQPELFAMQYGIEDFPTSIVISPEGVLEQVDVTPDARLIEQLMALAKSQTTKRPTTQPAAH